MADVTVDTSSYPKPGPPVNPLDQITKVGQVAQTLGGIEAGKAVQGAIGPDGEIDRNALAQALKGTVAGSMQAIPTLNAYEQLRTAGHVADVAGLDNFQKRMALINHLFGQLASQDSPTIQDVNAVAARVLDPAVNGPKYGVTFPVVMNALKNFRGPDGRPLSSAQIKQRALETQTMTASTAEQLAAHSPRYSVQDDGSTIRFQPTGTEINPQYPAIVKRIPTGTPVYPPGSRVPVLTPPQEPAPAMEMDRRGVMMPARPVPTTNPLSSVVTPNQRVADSFSDAYGNRMNNAPAAGLAPGVAAAATSTAANSAELANRLTTAASEVPQTRAILDNLDRELEGFTPGPGADYRRIGKAFANTMVPESLQSTLGFDPKSIADQEGFNKLAFQLAENELQALGGTGTDAKLDSAMHTSPNELITKLGNKGIMQLLKGNTDAIAAKAKAWNAWQKVHGPDSMADFNEDFNETFNPRVLQLKYIPKKDRQSWYRSMSPEDRRNFEDATDYAMDRKWVPDTRGK